MEWGHDVRKIRDEMLAPLNRVPLPYHFDMANTVLLTGSPRSGTTWLGQVLSASPGYCLVTEPLHPKMPGLREAGFSWRIYVDPDAEWPEGRAIFERLFRGRGVTLKLLHRNWRSLPSARGLILKAVRANRLLPWLSGRFPIRGTILLIRHPCAAVSSQMAYRMGRSTRVQDFNRDYLERRLPHVIPFANTLRTEEEFRALLWCCDQHAPLAAPEPTGWVRVSYEKLVAEGEPELRNVFSAVGLSVSADVLARFQANSFQAQDFSVDHTRASVEERLGVWKRRLDQGQIERILAVVEACGIRGFSEDVIPDYDRIGVDT